MRIAFFGLNVEEFSDFGDVLCFFFLFRNKKGPKLILFYSIFFYILAFDFIIICCNFGSDSRGWNEWAV